MAITVRYGNTGDLAQLAVTAGQGQAFVQRFQMGQQLVQQARQHQLQQDAMRLEAQRLQQASQLQRSMQSASPTSGVQHVRSPFVESVGRAVQPSTPVADATAFASMSAEDRRNLQDAMAVGDRQLASTILQRSMREREPGRGTVTIKTPDGKTRSVSVEQARNIAPEQLTASTRAKEALLQTAPIPPELQQQLEPLIYDDKVDVGEVRRTIESFQRQTGAPVGLTPYQQMQSQLRPIQTRRRDLERQIRSVEQAAQQGFGNRGADMSIPFGDLTSEREINTRLKIMELQKQVDELLDEERSVTEQAMAGGAPAASPTGETPRRVTTQAEYDALPSGALFIDPGDGQVYRKD